MGTEQDAIDAALWRKHKDLFPILAAMLEAATPLILHKLKAQDAAKDATHGPRHVPRP